MTRLDLETTCPHCGAVHDACSDPIGDHRPSPEDFTFCIECGEWAVFQEDLSLRLPTVEEYIDLGKDGIARELRLAWIAACKPKQA